MNSLLIPYHSIPNCRDLAPLVNREGFHIRENMLIRSSHLVQASREDLEDLYYTHNVRKVFDFRSATEKMEKPERLMEGMTYRDHSIQKEQNIGIEQSEDAIAKRKAYFEALFARVANDIEAGMDNMCSFYRDMATDDYSQQQYGRFLKEVLESEGGVLWHCSLGKDRCGVGTALLLHVLDFSDEVIMEDYLYTNICLHGRHEILCGMDTNVFAHPDFLNAYYDCIKEQFESIDNFLKYLGIDEKTKEAFKKKYLIKGDKAYEPY